MEVVATKQDYDEFEMLLGEIPNVTSTVPQAEADVKPPLREERKEVRSSVSSTYRNLYRSPQVAKQGDDVAYSILNLADDVFDEVLQSNGKIDDVQSGYRPENLDESFLPDEPSLTSSLENLSIEDSIGRGPIMSSSIPCNKASHIHGLEFDGQYLSPVKKGFPPLASVDVSVPQIPHPLDGINMSNPTFQEHPPLKTGMSDKFRFQVNNQVGKLPKLNSHEVASQKSDSFSNVIRDQRHNPGSMYPGSMSFIPGRNPFQLFSGVSFSGAEFPSSPFQKQCYLEAQPPTYLPPQHFSQPQVPWQKLQDDRYHRMHHQYFYVQQFQNQEAPPFQKGNNALIGSLTGSPMQPYFELPSSHQIEQTDQEHYWSRSVLHGGVNQLGLASVGGHSYRCYTQGFCGKEENCTYAHVQKQSTGSSLRYSSKDFTGGHALNKFGKQIVPKKILTRSQGSSSLRTLRSSPVASNQSPTNVGFEGPVLPNGLLQTPLQISTSLQADREDVEGSDNSGDIITSRSPKPKYKSLNEVIGKIYALAQDPHGCRFLQEKFAEGTPEDVHKVFVEIIDHIVELMTDPYGNYLVQKMLEVCNEDQKRYIIHAITSKDGELIRISCDMHGTRTIQKVIETLKTPEEVSMVVSSVKPGILALIKDNNGNHVAQRCLQCLSPEFSKFLFDAAIAHCIELARDRRGCCVLQKCLSHCSGQQREQLISEISCNALVLSQDPFGNYVVQYLFDLDVASASEGVLDQLEDNFGYLSMQKYSSNVVEKCLKCAREDRRVRIIWELINNPHLLQILQDPFGNYVIQSAIKLCKGAVHTAFVKAIRPHIPALRSNPYGRKVLSSFSTKK